jgi:hypothetical protein
VADFGVALLAVIVATALLAPLISPQNPYDLAQLDVMDARLPPGSQSPGGGTFWLGTDDQGRDMLSAIFYGLRISLTVGVISTAIALTIGLAMGLTAAYFGGKTEAIIMRIADIQLSFPAILIALILLAVLGQGTFKIVAALVTVQWAYYARTVRSAALVEKRKEYIEAARCPLSPWRIVFAPAELPATLARGRNGAGRGGDCARSALLSGPRAADHRTVAGAADATATSICCPANTGSASSPALHCCSRSSASTSSPISCATCSTLGCSDERCRAAPRTPARAGRSQGAKRAS